MDETYHLRRSKNNEAVKKSREKTRKQTQEMIQRVERLKAENADLTDKIKLLHKELGLLKQLFIEHAGSSHGLKLTQDQFQLLQDEMDSGDLEKLTKNSSSAEF